MSENKIIGKIRSAELILSGTDKKGCYIKFISEEKVNPDDIFQVKVDKTRSFEVQSISTSEVGNFLSIVAIETGGWSGKVEKAKGFDIRSLLYQDVILLQDPEVIKSIRQAATYC